MRWSISSKEDSRTQVWSHWREKIDGGHFPDQTGADCIAQVAEVGRPASVLVDRELEPFFVSQIDEFFAFLQIEDEGFLTEEVLACPQAVEKDGQAVGGVGRDVHDLDVIPFEDFPVILVDRSLGIELVTHGLGFGRGAVGKGDYAVAASPVVFEVKLTDPPGPDQGDARVVFFGAGRKVMDLGRLDDFCFFLRAEPVFLFLTHAGRSVAQTDFLHHAGGLPIGFLDPFHDLFRIGRILELKGYGSVDFQFLDGLEVRHEFDHTPTGGKVAVDLAVAVADMDVAAFPFRQETSAGETSANTR